MTDSRPIGIFDSGIGGLPIAQKIRASLPHENLIYLADTLHAPYGEKSEDYILQRSLAITDWFITQKVKAIVVACNTATMISIQTLRNTYDLPFIGVEPGVKPAAIHTQTGVIGVLATPKTLTSTAFHQLAQRVAGHVQVEMQPCPKLVHLVESLELDSDNTHQIVADYVQPLINKGADTLILGCTHFAHLTPIIKQAAGHAIEVISTETPVAKEVARRLKHENLISDQTQAGITKFYSNGDLIRFQQQLQRLWGENAQAERFNA